MPARRRRAAPERTAEVRSPKKSRLLHFDELEDWRRDNEFIRTGYVPSYASVKKCVHSLGFLHNETVNVYSHLIPSVVVLCIQLFAVVEITRPFTLFFMGCAACMGISAFYHLFSSHSLAVARIGNKFDYVGICILIAASMIALIQIAYNDHERERQFFLGMTSIFAVLCSIVSLSDTFRTPHFRGFRAAMFVLYGLSGVFPVFFGFHKFGYKETTLRTASPWLYAEAFMYIFGAALYAVRFPEKWHPGKYDIWGHSHQIFHFFVVAGAYCHYRALRDAYWYAVIRNLAKM